MDLDTLRTSFTSNPADVANFEKLQDALLESGALADLKTVYDIFFERVTDQGVRDRVLRSMDQKTKTVPDEGIQSWLSAQLGLIWWQTLKNADRAEVYFRRLQSAAGADGMVADFYIEYYSARDNWRRLEQMFGEAGLDSLSVKRRLAQIASDKGKADRALGFWQAVHTEDPSDEETYDRLRTLYTQVQKWHSLVELLKSKLDRLVAEGDKDGAIALHREMIRIYADYIKSETKVIAGWQDILKLDPGNVEAQEALEKLYEDMKRWPDLVRVLQGRLDFAKEPKEQVALHRRIAGIMLERFSNSSEAIKHYQSIIGLDSDNLEAIQKLKELYEQRKSWEQYVVVARREIELTHSNDKARAKAFVELANLASERIRSAAVAIELWENVRVREPAHPEALAQLEALYEREKQYEKLIEVLEARYEQTSDKDSRSKLLEKLAIIYGTRLNDDVRTADVWRRVLETDPDNKKALAELKKRYLQINDFDRLEALYRRYATMLELVRALDAQLPSVEAAHRLPLLLKVAALWLEQGDVQRSVKALETVLGEDPGNAGAARQLIPIYRDQGEVQKLPAVYDVVLESVADVAARRPLLVEKAELLEQHLGDLDSAFFCYVEAVKEDPRDPELRAGFDRLAEASQNWEVYASVLEETVDADDSRAAARTLLRAAWVYHQRLQDPERALGIYQRVLDEHDSKSHEAIDATESIYRETGRWPELVEALERKLEQGGLSTDDEKAVRFELGTTRRDRLSEPEAAMGVFREMLDRFPEDTRVHDELCRLHAEAEDWSALAEVLNRKSRALADQADAVPAELADLHVQLGMLAYAQKNDVADAIEHYKEALLADPTSDVATKSLEELLASEAHREEIALTLENVYRQRGDDAKLADALEIQMLTATEKNDQKRQKALLRRLITLYRDKTANAERALWAASRLYELEPGRKELRGQIEALVEQLGEWAHFADLYELSVEQVTDKDARIHIYEKIATAAHTHLHDAARAERLYRTILEEQPQHAGALDALELLYLETEQHEKLLDILRKKEELATTDADRIEFRFQTAGLLADQLQRLDDAVDDLRGILGLSPNHPIALLRLDELFERAERWEDLHDVLLTRSRLAADPKDRAALLVRLAEVRETQLGEVSQAIETYADILAIDPAQADAIAALERHFDTPEHAERIATILEPTYKSLDQWTGLAKVYGVLESATDDLEKKVDLLYRTAKLYEHKATDPVSAFAFYGRAYAIDPQKPATLTQLLRLAEALHDYEELTALLKAHVEDVPDLERRKEIHRIIAELRKDQCGDVQGAIEQHWKVLEISEGDLTAIDALVALYRERQMWGPLVDMLRMKAPLMEVDELKKEILLEVGDLCATTLDDKAQAIDVYEDVLRLDPADATALDRTAQLYEESQAWADLTRALQRKIDQTKDLEQKKALGRELAGVQEVYLEDLDAAIDAHRTILAWDETDVAELHALSELLTKTERWLDLLPILDKQAALLDAEAKTELWLRKARILNRDLGDVMESIKVLEQVLAHAPGNTRAVEHLDSLVRTADEREMAFTVLEPVLLAASDWGRLIELYDVLVANRDDAFSRIDALHRMARICEERLGDAERAFLCYGRALREDLYHQASRTAVDRLAQAHGLWESLCSLLLDAGESADDPTQAMALRLRAGEVLKDEIGDFDRAVAVYRLVTDEQADHPQALEALDDLYQVTEQWVELALVLQAEIDVASEADKKIGLYFRLAEVAEHRIGDLDQPFVCYREVFYLDRNQPVALEHLERLARIGVHRSDIAGLLEPVYVERGEWQKLHDLKELVLESTSDAGERLDLIRQLADLDLERLGKKSDAVRWLSEAFRLDPMDDLLLQRLETLAAETGDWARVKETLLAVAIGLDDPPRKIALWHKGARIMHDQLLDGGQAELIYELILAEDDNDLPALQALDKLYLGAHRWAELEIALERQIAAAPYDDDKLALLLRLGALLRDKLARADDAVIAYERALEIQDTHPEALEAVANLHRAAERWADLYATLRRQVDTADNTETRQLLLYEMAELAEQKLHNAEDATALWDELLSQDTSSTDAIRNIQRLHERAGNGAALADAYARELSILGDKEPERRAAIYRELGRLQGDQLGDDLQALDAWEKLLELDDHDIEAMVAITRIHEAQQSFEALAQMLERMVASLRFEGADLLALWQRLARLYTETIPEPEKAIFAWTKVRDAEPGNLEALDALDKLFNEQARWEDAVLVLEAKVAVIPSDEAVDTWMRLGEVRHYQLGAWEAAAEAYAKVVALEPNNTDAGERLEALYTEHERWMSLADLLGKRVERLVGEGGDGLDIRDLYLRIAEVHERRLEDPVSALLYLQAAHQQARGDLDVLAGIERLCEATESWRDLLGEYETAISASNDVDGRIDLELRAARLCRDRLDDKTAAIKHLHAVLAIDENHEEALTAIATLFEITGRWSDLVVALERRYQATNDSFDKTQIGLRIGEVLRDEVSDRGAAVEAFKRVLDLGGDERAATALEALYEQLSRWPELIGVLEQKVALGYGDETETRLRIGEVRQGQLGDLDGAIAAYEDILGYNETQRQALERLRDLYGGKDDYENLTKVYERLLHTAQNDAEQLKYCGDLALLQLTIHDNPEAAADYYHRMLSIDSSNADALAALERIYGDGGRFEDLLDVYRRRLELVADDESAWVFLKENMARIYAEKLSDPDNAIYGYRELLSRVPSHKVSLDALDRLYRETSQWESVQDVLERKAYHATSTAERGELLCERSSILLEKLRDPDQALSILQQALRDEPGHRRGLELLVRIYEAREEWENMIDALRRQSMYLETDHERSAIERRIAAVYRDRLHDGMHALEHLEKANELVPDDVETNEQLAKLYLIAEDWVKAETLLQMIVDRSDGKPNAWVADVHFQHGMALEKLLKPEEAYLAYESAFKLRPDDAETARAVGRMAFELGDFLRAEQILKTVIERRGSDATESELVMLYQQLGDIALKRGDEAGARAYLEKTIEFQPGNAEALKNLLDLCTSQKYWNGVIHYGTELLSTVDDPLAKFDLQIRLGDVYLKHMSRPNDAVMCYRSALDYQPKSKAAHLKIVQVLTEAARYDEAIEILERIVELEDDPKRKATFAGAIAEIYREKLKVTDKAIEWFSRALDHDSSQLKMFRAIDELLTDQRDWKALQKAYRQMLSRVSDDESQSALQYKLCFNLGEIYRTRLQQKDKAKESFEAALDIKPNDTKALEILSELYEVDEEYDKAIAKERQLMLIEPGEIRHYKNLKRLFHDAKNLDGAWVATGVLALLGQADEREQAFYRDYLGANMVTTAGTAQDLWAKSLVSKGEDLAMANLFSVIYQGIGAQLVTKDLDDLGFKKKAKIDPADRELFAHVYGTASRVLGLTPPPGVYHSAKSTGMIIETTMPPIIVISDELRQGKTEQELAFVVGKVLTYFHPLHTLVCIAQPETLQFLLNVALSLHVRDADMAALAGNQAFQQYREALSALPTQLKVPLEKWTLETWKKSGGKPNVARWLNQIELTANHAGLFLSNDVVLAGRMLKAEGYQTLFTAPSKLPARDKLVDLAVYALSEEYLDLRREAGIAVTE